jgi:L-asparagine transporter-like permease
MKSHRGILFSGVGMLGGLGLGLLFPRVYLFLISAGGFATLYTYAAILATHIKFRKCHGCPPEGKCQMPGFPYTTWIALISIIVIILSMPLIPGQASGLIAGIVMVVIFYAIYFIMKHVTKTRDLKDNPQRYRTRFSEEFSKELTKDDTNKQDDNKSCK